MRWQPGERGWVRTDGEYDLAIIQTATKTLSMAVIRKLDNSNLGLGPVQKFKKLIALRNMTEVECMSTCDLWFWFLCEAKREASENSVEAAQPRAEPSGQT